MKLYPLVEDNMFVGGKNFVQRLIFYGGNPWEDYEMKELIKFDAFLKAQKVELPPQYFSLKNFFINVDSGRRRSCVTYWPRASITKRHSRILSIMSNGRLASFPLRSTLRSKNTL
jgi:hypothetical protein